jgi:hypothetical protein
MSLFVTRAAGLNVMHRMSDKTAALVNKAAAAR